MTSKPSRLSKRPTPAPTVAALDAGVIDHVADIPVELIRRSPFQVRPCDDQEHIASLAASISDNELSSPILVRPMPGRAGEGSRYELVCGENRWLAHKALGRATITAIVRFMTDAEAARVLAADNLQRRDLTDWQVCQSINMLLSNNFAKTEDDLARLLGRPRSYISKARAFNELPAEAAALVASHSHLFGAALAGDLRTSGFNHSHPALVVSCFKQVIAGSLTQAGVISALRNATSEQKSAPVRDSKLMINGKAVRLTIYADTVRVSCKGMDTTALESHLRSLLPQVI